MTDCGAKTRGGEPCRQPAMPNGRCRLHGGKTPSGIASPQFRHGRFSKVLPPRMVAGYEAHAADPDLLALDHELAVVRERLTDVLRRVDSGEAGAIWDALHAAHRRFKAAERAQDAAGMAEAWAEIEAAIARGRQDWAAWAEALRLIEAEGRLSEREQKRRVAMQQTIDRDQLHLLLATLMDILRRHVSNSTERAAIQDEFRALAARSQGQ